LARVTLPGCQTMLVAFPSVIALFSTFRRIATQFLNPTLKLAAR
jgi:hypothetical protein